MERREKKKRNPFAIIGFEVILLIIVIGASYAYLTFSVTNEKGSDVIAGVLALDFKEGNNGITIEEAVPVRDEEGMTVSPYEFSVENTGSIEVRYDLAIEDESGENGLSYQDLKFSLQKNGGEWSMPKLLSDLPKLVLDQGTLLEAKEKNTYALRIWIDQNASSDIAGKHFKGRLVVNGVQSNIATDDISPPIIYLLGESSMNVEEGSEFVDPGVESVEDDRDQLEKSEVRVSYEYEEGDTKEKLRG